MTDKDYDTLESLYVELVREGRQDLANALGALLDRLRELEFKK